MAKSKGPKKAPKPPLTHFVCVPLVTPASRPQLESSLNKFRGEVCSDVSKVDVAEPLLTAIPPKAIRPLGSIHCTLGVMSLSATSLARAIRYLQDLDVDGLLKTSASEPATADIVSNESQRVDPIMINMKGLVSMHDPEKTSILYCAPEDASQRLYPFCLELQRLFRKESFLVEDDRELKLHATIVNTIYAKGRKPPPRRGEASSSNINDGASGHGPNAKAPLKIDATGILQTYKDYVWAENVALDRIAICEMGAKPVLDYQGDQIDAEYKEVATRQLPS